MVLDALFKIKNEQDPTFVFRRYEISRTDLRIDRAVRVFAVRVP